MDEDQHKSPDAGPSGAAGVGPVDMSAMTAAERAVDELLRDAHFAAAHHLPDLVARHAATMGVTDAVMYLADLQQQLLVPFLSGHAAFGERPTALGVDSTVAGRAFQQVQVLTQDGGAAGSRVWLPLLDGTERLGVLAVTLHDVRLLEESGGVLSQRLERFAALVAELVMTKTQYGDTIVRLRRTSEMGLAAEIQWALLPPLTFADETVSVAGALEPAYEVAGDSLDYAVDAGVARLAVFDGMGHGLTSAQLVGLAVAAYRNARRAGRSLADTAQLIESAVTAGFPGEAFSTGLLGELDTGTGVFTWMSAGHLEPLVLREGRLVKTLELEPALPFGISHGLPSPLPAANMGSEQLQPGDLLLLYTDGVTEARSPDGDFFGVERLIDLVVRNLSAGLPAPETMRRLVRALLDHQSGDLDDDATLLLVQWHGGRSSGS